MFWEHGVPEDSLHSKNGGSQAQSEHSEAGSEAAGASELRWEAAELDRGRAQRARQERGEADWCRAVRPCPAAHMRAARHLPAAATVSAQRAWHA